MSVQKVSYSMEVPKEGKEVVDAVSSLLSHFTNGGSLADAAQYLPKVMSAVEGVQGIGEELKSDGKDELAGYLVHKVMGSLEKKA